MANYKQLSDLEEKLLLELEFIMIKHRRDCLYLENIKDSNQAYLYRIKKALLHSKVEEKRVAVLKSIIRTVKISINNGIWFKEIFEPLPEIISDRLKSYRKNTKINNEELTDNKIQNLENKKIEHFDNIIDIGLAMFGDLSRDQLLELEVTCNKNIRNNTENYGINKANVILLGNFNTGMLETTRKNFAKLLNEKYGIVLKENDKLSDKMSDELLLYKVIGLYYTNVMAKHRVDKIKPEPDSTYVNTDEFKILEYDTYLLGKTIRNRYLNGFGLSPKEELIESYDNGQLVIEEVMKKTRKK